MEIISTDDGICLLEFKPKDDIHPNVEKVKSYFNSDLIKEENLHIKALKKELDSYFKGELKSFEAPLVLTGSDFQNSVWNALLKVPYAETRTYKEQSIIVGDVKAIRAVASANGANRIAIVIPCHRIIGSDGSMTGYAGGIDKKKFLLNLERQVAGPKDLFNS